MNIVIYIAQRWMPAYIKKRQLLLLFKITARAFERPIPALSKLSYNDILEAFCTFTFENANEVLNAPKMDYQLAYERLYGEAKALGIQVRKTLRLHKTEEIKRLIFVLYRNIGIELKGNIPGEFRVSTCYFSEKYTPPVCLFISALDAGIIAGLFENGELKFSQRITEGCPCCVAHFCGGVL